MAGMDIRYTDTRGAVKDPVSFSDALLQGLAPGGGLFVPEVVPQATLGSVLALAELPYAERAARVYSWFGVDFSDEDLARLMKTAYADNFDTPAICPIEQVGDTYVLELWHGPTSAFKDMALQCLPVFFSETVSRRLAAGEAQSDYLIAVATSGDTGKAALRGFADRDHISIVVYYPDGGVSDIQYKQMATQEGANVSVFGVRGNFDDCQTGVKRMFADAGFAERLAAEHNIALSSANSINWGRLLPQVVYYLSAYAQMVADGRVAAGEPIDVCVPTGNFGNILACWYAKQVGAPIDRIICASNANRVLTDFIETGTYTVAGRDFVLTPSPSMDILVSSNLERQLFELTGRDAGRISGWMKDLKEKGAFSVDEATFARLQREYRCGSVSNAECLETIRAVEDAHGYLLDPHTAVAWAVAQRHRSDNPLLVASTAHWAKFGADVYRALSGIAAGEPLPAQVAGLTGPALNRAVVDLRGGRGFIPPALDALDEAPIRFTEVIDGNVDALEASVEGFLA